MHKCTECGKGGATYLNRDAGNAKHYFHPACYQQLRWWLAGHNTKVPKKYKDAASRGEIHRKMPLAKVRA